MSRRKSKKPLAGRSNTVAAEGTSATPSDFSAMEAEFFAREADLYKVEQADSFDDLDDN